MNEQIFRGSPAPDRDYALGFQPDGVQLLRRDSDGWAELGRAAFNGDLRGGLGAFAQTLRAAEVPGLALVIPQDQILYTDLILPQAETTQAAVRVGLDGMTPYRVDELAFDFAPADAAPGQTVKIAAVARQTLQEAEDFAVRHGFAPDRFLAAPMPGQFPHMPDFGGTELASEWERAREVTETLAPQEAVSPQEAVGMEVSDTGVGSPPVPEDKAASETAQPQPHDGNVISRAGQPADARLSDPDLAGRAGSEDTAQPATAGSAGKSAMEDTGTAVSRIIPHVVLTAKGSASVPGFALETGGHAAVNRESIVLPGEEPVEGAASAELSPADDDPSSAAPAQEGPASATEAAPPKPLPERAKKFHERAAEGRKLRAAPAVAPRKSADQGRRTGLTGALPLVGILVLALGIAAVMIGRDSGSVDQASVETETAVAPAQDGPLQATVDSQPDTGAAPAPAAQPSADPVPDAETSVEASAVTSVPASPMPRQQAAGEPSAADMTPESAAQDALAATPSGTVSSPAQSGNAGQSVVTPPADAPITGETASTATSAAATMVQSVYDTPAEAAGAPEVQPVPDIATAPARSAQERRQTTAPAGAAAQAPRRPVATSARPPARPSGLAQRQPASQAAPASSRESAAIDRAAPVRPESRPSAPSAATPQQQQAATGAAARTAAPGAPSSTTLQSSARPQSAPSRNAEPAQASAAPDPRPAVPRSPPPYQQRAEPEPSEPTGTRPPPKPSVPQSSTEAQGAALQLQPAPRHMAWLSVDSYDEMLARLDRPWLEPRAGTFPLIRTAQSRPTPRPTRSDAVDSALAEAIGSQRPAARSDADATDAAPADPPPTATRQASAAGSAGRLTQSARPQRRPGSASGGAQVASDAAVEAAIASAVDRSTAVPGQVAALRPLTSSARPMRRGSAPGSTGGTDNAVNEALAAAPAGREGTLAPEPSQSAASKAQAEAAALAERRRLDEELQQQAEQRVRDRAAADARAAAQAKAAAEARARAQAEAEAAAAARRNQTYRPPEVDNEPEVQSTASSGSGSAAQNATARGIDLNATQLIGTVGAGKASRGLVRLRNGRIVKVRLGDKINGGQIVEIGNGGLHYVKGGRKYALPILNGR